MTNYYTVKTEPTDQLVTLSEARDWISIDSDITEHDELLQSLILATTDLGQRWTNRIFVNTEFEGFFDCLQISKFEVAPYVDIKRAPLIAISALEIFTNGVWTAFIDYITKPTSGFTRILFPNGITVSSYTVPYILKITFTAGYATVTVVPETIKTGIKQHIAFLYENRGDVQAESKKGIPAEVKAMYSKYRISYTY